MRLIVLGPHFAAEPDKISAAWLERGAIWLIVDGCSVRAVNDAAATMGTEDGAAAIVKFIDQLNDARGQ